jgi:hypothetical protein
MGSAPDEEKTMKLIVATTQRISMDMAMRFSMYVLRVSGSFSCCV